jgi:hypothetical protein
VGVEASNKTEDVETPTAVEASNKTEDAETLAAVEASDEPEEGETPTAVEASNKTEDAETLAAVDAKRAAPASSSTRCGRNRICRRRLRSAEAPALSVPCWCY